MSGFWGRRGWLIVGAVFLVLLWLPPLQALTGFAPEPRRSENRRLAPWPGIPRNGEQVAAVRAGLGAYFDDHFGFRKTLVRGYNVAGLWLFGRSPVSRVIAGREGWLYLAAKDPVRLPARAAPFTPSELARWLADLEQRRAALAAEGIRYLFVIVPDKLSAYPEFLPPRLRRASLDARLNQLTAELQARSSVELLNLRPALSAAKAEGRLYHRTDTHWNDLGAYVGYREIIGRLGRWLPDLAARPLAAFERRTRRVDGGNLARMLAMADLLQEDDLRLIPREPYRWQEGEAARTRRTSDTLLRARERPGSGLPRAVMLHDSYGNGMMGYLSEHFSRIVFVRRRELDLELIRRERPDVVIQQVGEGALEYPGLR